MTLQWFVLESLEALETVLAEAGHELEVPLVRCLDGETRVWSCEQCGDDVSLCAQEVEAQDGMAAVFPARMLVGCVPLAFLSVTIPRGMSDRVREPQELRREGRDGRW